MTVYLLHFSSPISPDHTAQHYLGSTDNLSRRLAEHRAGRGARLCEVALERGIGFVLARTWTGDRRTERKLKRRKEGPRLCPICNRRHEQPHLFLDARLDFRLDELDPLPY